MASGSRRSRRRKSSKLRNRKKQKVSGAEEPSEDRISELPESLLVQILSLLPTEDAFATRILSKRWRYLWTYIYNFSFTRCLEKENCLSFVDYVLAHSVSSKIIKLEILVGRLDEYFPNASKCLSFSVEKNVEDVVIWSHVGSEITLPESFCTCSSLLALQIKWCEVHFDDMVIAWKSLKSIKLEGLVLSDASILNLFSGCPALETVECIGVGGFNRLETNSIKLKRLKIKYWLCHVENDHSLEIIAPYLQHLEIAGGLSDFKCRLVDVSSVVNAKLTFNITCIKDISGNHGEEFDDNDDEEDSCRDYHQVFWALIQDYLQKFSCATELTIGSWFTQVLCILQFKRMAIPELKCKYLTLELYIRNFNLSGVAGLLQASPHVDTLNIDMSTMHPDYSLCRFELGCLDEGDNIDLQSRISSFGFPNLKKVKISSGRCLKNPSVQDFEKFYQLSKFLLIAATVLEKFVITSKRIVCHKCSTKCGSHLFSRLAKKLLGCPRSSPKSMIIVKG